MNDDANNLCGELDAYFDGELSDDVQQAFVAHLSQCPACRDAIDQQRWIDSLLQSDAAAELETPLVIKLRPRRRRRWQVAAAAAAVAALAAYVPFPRRDGSNRARSPVATERRAVAELASSPQAMATVENPSLHPSLPGRGTVAPAAKFVSVGSAIAVSVTSPDQRVTVVKLYPTATASRRWARESALRAIAIHPNGG